MKTAIASLTLLFAACSAPQAPAPPEPPVAPAAPSNVPAATPASDAPMAKRAPGDTTPPMQVFRAFGTEPFWNVNVEGATLTYTTPDDQAGVVMQGERRAMDGGVEIAGDHGGKAFVLRVTPGECSDGMSDNRYTLVSTFRYGDIDYTGCGEAAK